MSFIVKNTTIISPLDLIAPHTCRGCGEIGSVLCKRCKNYILSSRKNFCPLCKTKTKNGKCKNCGLPPFYTIGLRKGLIGDLIHDYKYNSTRAIGTVLAELAASVLPQIEDPVCIIPLPTISKHIRMRGLDHTLTIARKLARIKGYKYKRALVRASNTVQVGSNRQERQKQAKSAYQLNPKIHIDSSTTYILLDDVWTTGSSMLAAKKKLQDAGASKIILVALAVS